jgi:hypothetical protein
MTLHPIVVHLPIALAVVMPLLSAALVVAWWRGALPRRAWIVAIALHGVLVVTGLAALRTGGDDAETVERVVPEAAIEAHEEAAETFVAAAAAALILMLAAGLTRRDGVARVIAALSIVASLGVLGLGYRAGKAGGELVYRHNAAAAFTTGARPPAVHPRDDLD